MTRTLKDVHPDERGMPIAVWLAEREARIFAEGKQRYRDRLNGKGPKVEQEKPVFGRKAA